VTPEERYAQAQREHPDVSVTFEDFEQHWNERAREAPIADARAGDLLLAAGIELGDAAALKWLLLSVRRAAAGQTRVSPQHAAEVESGAVATVAVGSGGERPRISRYSAQGPLTAWLQVVVARTAGGLARTKGYAPKEAELDGALEMGAPAQAPEVAVLKQRFGGVVGEAMRAAAAKLEARDRALLAMKYVDGLSIDEIGRAYRTHRATAARWVEGARNALLEALRDELAQRVGVSRLEVDSLVRALSARVDISLRLVLKDEAPGQRSKQ
jgi:RNA polymerase sigma-70 factor (ECF subfamily)